VLDVRGWPFFGAALEELYRAATVFAAELGVVVFECDVDELYLPEGLITTGCADATAFDFTFIEPFPFDCHDEPRLDKAIEFQR
jgi:hypothetical protein